jgi:hypothetical protein
MSSDIELEILRKRGRTTVLQGKSEAVPPDAIAAFMRHQRSAMEFSQLLLSLQNFAGRPGEADPLFNRGAILAIQIRGLASELNQYPGVSYINGSDSESAYFSDIAGVADEAYHSRISELVDICLYMALQTGLQIDPDVLRLRWTEVKITKKLTTYLLNDKHRVGMHKARVFKTALGFSSDNAEELASQIKFDPNKEYETKRKTWVDDDQVPRQGTEVRQVLLITGANGRSIPVKCGWMIYPDGTLSFKTAIPL